MRTLERKRNGSTVTIDTYKCKLNPYYLLFITDYTNNQLTATDYLRSRVRTLNFPFPKISPYDAKTVYSYPGHMPYKVINQLPFYLSITSAN